MPIESYFGTGSTIDLSLDGNWFAEGGGWGKSAIKITDTQTGKTHLLDGRGQKVTPFQPGELETRLQREKELRRLALREAKARRAQQAAVGTAAFKVQVYLRFAHYGEMTDPWQARLLKSDEPHKSNIQKPAADPHCCLAAAAQ